MNPTVFDQNSFFVPFQMTVFTRLRLFLFLLQQGIPWLQAGRLCLFHLVPCWAPGFRRMPLERVAALLSREPMGSKPSRARIFLIDFKNSLEPIRGIDLSHEKVVNYRSRFHQLLEAVTDYFSEAHEQALLGSAEAKILAVNKKVALKAVFESQAVKEELQKHPSKQALSIAKKYANEIICNRHFIMIHFWNFVLGFLMKRLFKDMHIDGMEHIKAIDSKHKTIYLPTHRSHLDFILLPLLLFKNGVETPQIASSNHLNRFFLRTVIHCSLGYFIRRKKMDPLYNAIMFEFLKIAQEEGTPEMVFIEGTRSKIGETLQPKAGMLSQYIDAYMKQKCHPIAFVPINITYDKVLERSHYVEPIIQHKIENDLLSSEEVNSLRALPSKGFWQSLLAVFSILRHGSNASVYVHCGKPIYLEEVLLQHSLALDSSLPRTDGIPHGAIRAVARDIAQKACTDMNSLTPLTTMGVASLLFWQNHTVSHGDLDSFTRLTGKLQNRSGLFHKNYLSPSLSTHDVRHISSQLPSQKAASSKTETVNHGYELRITIQEQMFLYLNQRNVIHGFILPSFVAKKILIDGVREPEYIFDLFEEESKRLGVKYHIDFGQLQWRKQIAEILSVLEEEALVVVSGNVATIQIVADTKGRRMLESLAKLSSAL